MLAFVAGALFCGGVSLSGMTQPGKVVGFLDVTGDFDPSLALVMVSAIAVYATALAVSRRLRAPLLGSAFPSPASTEIDGRLVAGAAVFGVGWGLAGFCPGPAIASLAAGAHTALLFTPSMLAGMALFQLVDRRMGREDETRNRAAT
ncbi:MAG: sulfur transport family protein [Myxococcales bacterium]|nr:sulfur transport family protein [Myxococcales bacterium]